MTTATGVSSAAAIELVERFGAHNYHPLPVVAASAEGAWITDPEGNRYLDCLAAYSAVNFGHGHPVLLAAARDQLDRVTLTSRAFHNDRLGPFLEALARLAKKDMVLPMNTGAEAVESAIKVARAWGYRVKGVADGRAKIIVADGNFHGRTTTIVGFSSDPDARNDFGPFTPGFVSVPYGDAAALEAALDDDTVAVMLEPIQGEAGVVVPRAGYLAEVRRMTAERNVLFIADEIQSGLGRTGATFQCDNEGVVPDLYLLGKALGGGIVPVSAVVGNADILGVLRPGEHGSTFGGNPLAAAVGLAVVELLETGEYQQRARELGAHLQSRLRGLIGQGVSAVRGVGLWAGVDIDPKLGSGREVCEQLMARGILAKDTHGSTIRFAPPIVVERADLDLAVDALAAVLTGLKK
ncbi:MAG: ornithine--oxo-acid transaminase [Pseudolysinimonas sp.]|uniref:ornithine--oxo-acid transaminase n=1 Tax=Pseudolysinimonas sp. TaxID=2680009 RepID=UPI003C790A3A